MSVEKLLKIFFKEDKETDKQNKNSRKWGFFVQPPFRYELLGFGEIFGVFEVHEM